MTMTEELREALLYGVTSGTVKRLEELYHRCKGETFEPGSDAARAQVRLTAYFGDDKWHKSCARYDSVVNLLEVRRVNNTNTNTN